MEQQLGVFIAYVAAGSSPRVRGGAGPLAIGIAGVSR
jgi:hypothetical protein